MKMSIMNSLPHQLANPNTAALIPFDKSWIIRMGILDLLHDKRDIDDFLSEHSQELNDDLRALGRAVVAWRNHEPIDVGESGTLYRFLQYLSWKLGRDDVFIKQGTLTHREVNADASIIALSQEELLALDNHTSQWASAAALAGDAQRIANPPFKLQTTYDAIAHWQKQNDIGQSWEARKDATIERQVRAYTEWKRTKTMRFIPEQAEDYCFARAFDLMSAEDGEKHWPALRGHESDRIAEMEHCIKTEVIASQDHRVVQALAMRYGDEKKFLHPNCVTKSWPQFWDFLRTAK